MAEEKEFTPDKYMLEGQLDKLKDMTLSILHQPSFCGLWRSFIY